MKKSLILLLLSLFFSLSFGQNKEEAENLIAEGIKYHDKGDYQGAIKLYDKALEADENNLFALAEKAMTLLTIQKFEESVAASRLAIEKHAGDKALDMVYATLGNALDGMKMPLEAVKAYDEGIQLFPNYNYLYFNKGVTLIGLKKMDEGFACFVKSAQIEPRHAGSHNAIARKMIADNKRIPAILALGRCLVLEPVGRRATENLYSLRELMGSGVEQTGKKNITISIDPGVLGDTTASGKPTENSFRLTDLILSMSSAMDYDKKNKKKTEVELFIEKFQNVCASMSETQADSYGFFWDYYVPYYLEMHENDLIEPFAYIIFASDDDPSIQKWIKNNELKIEEFFTWSSSFEWPQN